MKAPYNPHINRSGHITRGLVHHCFIHHPALLNSILKALTTKSQNHNLAHIDCGTTDKTLIRNHDFLESIDRGKKYVLGFSLTPVSILQGT
jgi:hypothetical protein